MCDFLIAAAASDTVVSLPDAWLAQYAPRLSMSASLSWLAIAFMNGFLRSPALNALGCWAMYVARCPGRGGVSPAWGTATWPASQARFLALRAAASPPASAAAGAID